MPDPFMSVVQTAIAMMVALFVATLLGLVLARRVARSKHGREAASKLIALGLFVAFFFLIVVPRWMHK